MVACRQRWSMVPWSLNHTRTIASISGLQRIGSLHILPILQRSVSDARCGSVFGVLLLTETTWWIISHFQWKLIHLSWSMNVYKCSQSNATYQTRFTSQDHIPNHYGTTTHLQDALMTAWVHGLMGVPLEWRHYYYLYILLFHDFWHVSVYIMLFF